MPIKRQDVNDDITAKVTGKTLAKSFSNIEDGANRVLMMDYVDQEILKLGVGYKIYTAFLEFVDSSTIVSTIFQNTIGDGSKDGVNDIAWSYNSAAQPKAVMTNAPFTNLKTLCSNSIYNVNMNLQGIRINSQQCRFYSSNMLTGAASLSFVPYVFVEIKVYN